MKYIDISTNQAGLIKDKFYAVYVTLYKETFRKLIFVKCIINKDRYPYTFNTIYEYKKSEIGLVEYPIDNKIYAFHRYQAYELNEEEILNYITINTV